LYDPLGTLVEQVGAIRQNTEDGDGHHGHGNGEKHPCPPPVQCAGWHKEQKSVNGQIENDPGNEFEGRHAIHKMNREVISDW
jgi:hypothetical protein